MNIKLISSLILVASTCNGYSQRLSEKIGNNPTIINASAVVEIESSTKGFLPPRMSQSDRDAIVAPAAGLMVWCTNCGRNGELQIFNGTFWTNTSGGIALNTLPNTTDGITLLSFMSHNLGADTSAPSTTPSWRLNGAYFQWGKKPTDTNSDWFISKSNDAASGFAAAPTGTDATQANSAAVAGWSSTNAPSNAWYSLGTDGYPDKTTNDPCPTGWRIPTRNEWASVSGWSNVGTSWAVSATNYTTGKIAGNLYLPAAGFRGDTGVLVNRGQSGYYWSSTSAFTDTAYGIFFTSGSSPNSLEDIRVYGYSIRCIKE